MENANATPAFLMGEEKVDMDDVLAQLSGLVETYQSLNNDIAEVEAHLRELKEKFNKVSQEEIPDLLNQYQLSEIRLKDGRKVIVKEDASVTITDNASFFAYLHNRDEDDIIKLMYNFSNRMQDEERQMLADFLVENGYDFEVDRSVHAQTKKKYFKEMLGLGKPDFEEGIASGKYMKLTDLPAWAKVFLLKKTTIK